MDNRRNVIIQSKQLNDLRSMYRYTQEQMAEVLGVSESLYKKMEKGIVPISNKTAEAIESRFGVSAIGIQEGVFRDDADVWVQVLECDDSDKMRIMLRLIKYFFSDTKYGEFKKIILESLNDIEEI